MYWTYFFVFGFNWVSSLRISHEVESCSHKTLSSSVFSVRMSEQILFPFYPSFIAVFYLTVVKLCHFCIDFQLMFSKYFLDLTDIRVLVPNEL